MLLKACLNGSREPHEHPALPVTPEAIARDAALCLAAGAMAVHVHPRDATGRETLDPEICGRVVSEIRGAAPALPVGLSTGAWIEPDTERRLALVRAWKVRPDFASVNLSESGHAELALALLEQGIEVEAGVWSPADAMSLHSAGLAGRCLRVLVEAPGDDPAASATLVASIDDALDGLGIGAPRLYHGEGHATWRVIGDATRQGRDIRVGLEDVLTLPDGRIARDNADLVRHAIELAPRLQS